MKRIYYLLFIMSAIVMTNCGKESLQQRNGIITNAYTDSAMQFLKSRLSKDDFSTIDTATLSVLKYKETNVALKVFQKGASGQRFIMLHKSISSFDGNWVDLSNLNKTDTGGYNGKIILTTFENQPLNEFTVQNSRVVAIQNPSKNISSLKNNSAQNSKIDMSTPENPITLDEVVVIGYISSGEVTFMSMYWMFDQGSAYESMYTPYGGGGGGSGSSTIAIAPKYISPDHPIADIKKELGCFTIDKNAKYSVSVNVNQPVPNNREIADLSVDHKVGHTFMTIQETLPNGNVIIRNIGFYPKDYAMMGSAIDQSIFGEDSNTPYTASLKFTITSTEFATLRNRIFGDQQANYDLNNFNCTNAVLDAMNSINIKLPSTKSTDPLFSGNNPGDLGEDIRTMDINKFSSQNGNRQIIRTVSKDNDKIPPSRAGEC